MLPMILSPIMGQEKATKWSPMIGEAITKIKAGGYQNTKADVFRAIKDVQQNYGISKKHLSNMVGLLDNPAVSGVLNKIAPGATGSLRSLGNEICRGNEASTQTNGGVMQNKFPPLKKR